MVLEKNSRNATTQNYPKGKGGLDDFKFIYKNKIMIKKTFIFLSIFILSLFISTPSAYAALPQMIAGETSTLNEDVDHDLMIAGGEVVVDSNVAGDVYMAGGQVEISGMVGDDLHIAGGEVLISGVVKGDVITAGGKIRLDKDAIIEGYLIALGGQVTLEGQVKDSVRVFAGNLEVRSGAVLNNLEANVEEANISDLAIIQGEKQIHITPKMEKNIDKESRKPEFAGVYSAFKIIGFLSKLLVLLILVRFLGKHVNALISPILKSPISTLGWGTLKLFITPFIILTLLITIIGMPLAFILTVLYFLSFYLSSLVVSIALGQWFAGQKWFKVKNKYLQASLGLFVISLISIIPLIGTLVGLIILLLGLGAILEAVRKLI